MRLASALVAFLALATGLVGCASAPPPGLPAATHSIDTAFLGTWVASSKAQATIAPGPAGSFKVTVNDGAATRDLRGYLVKIDNRELCELQVYQPEGQERERNAVPVYHYAQVSVKGDTLTHTPLKAEWLKQQTKGSPNTTYVTTSELIAGSGGAVVRDGSAMLELLKKALKDPAAFEKPEVLTRQK